MMMIDMRSPCPIEWDQTSGIHSATKDILWNEIPFIPSNSLFPGMNMSTLPNISKPFMISVMAKVAMFQSFIDEHIR
jgi:hypothetical protein